MPPTKLWNTGVYCIRNLASGKVYVGSAAKSLTERRATHWRNLDRGNHHNRHLQSAWNKYKEASFRFEVLQKCAPGRCLEIETLWIAKLDSTNCRFGYNICKEGRNALGVKQSEKTKQKRAETIRANGGYQVSLETRAKQSAMRKGKFTAAQSQALKTARASWRGSTHTPEAIEKIRVTHLGKKRSEETRAKISLAGRGNKNASGKRSEEFREKMRAIRYAQIATRRQEKLDGPVIQVEETEQGANPQEQPAPMDRAKRGRF